MVGQRRSNMSLRKMIWCVAILTALVCIQAAPNHSKESAHDMESDSVSHEVESKEIYDESIEQDSEDQDKDSRPDKAYQISRYWYHPQMRPLRLPVTYGIPALGNPDMIPLAQVLEESVAEYLKYNHKGRTKQTSSKEDTGYFYKNY